MTRHEDQRRSFADEGYAVFERALEAPLLAILRHECAQVIAREDARLDALGVEVDGISHRGSRYFAGECQRAAPALRTVLFSATMAAICRATLGDDAYFFYDQYVVKGASAGLPFSWHPDSGYVVGNGGPVYHAPYLTCWCALDDMSVANGTVRLLPYSRAPGTRERIVAHVRQSGSNDLAVVTADEGVALEVPAGSVVAFSSRVLHATGANRTDRLRRVYLAQYSPEPILDPGSRHLRRNAIAFVRGGRQVTSPKGGLIDYVLGAYYLHAKTAERYQRTITTLPGPLTTTGIANYGVTSDNYALFGEANVNFTSSFRAIAGYRSIWDDVDFYHVRTSTFDPDDVGESNQALCAPASARITAPAAT